MPDYSKAYIYRLYCDNPELFYYGSSTARINHRLAHHKCSLKATSKRLFLESSNVKIELIEKYPCSSKKELANRERFFIENNQCVNFQLPARTDEEKKIYRINKYKIYYQKNKERINENSKNFKKKNKEQQDRYNKKYYEDKKASNTAPVVCPHCQITVQKVYLPRHIKNKH